MSAISLFVPEPLVGSSIAQPFWYRFEGVKGAILFDKNLPRNFFEYGVSLVPPDEARAIVLPHNFSRVLTSEEEAYVAHYAELGDKFGVPVFVFSLGDFSYQLHFDPRVYVFRQSVYRSSLEARDIVVPALTEDSAKEGITLRKKQQVPIVSFCGQGDYQTFQKQIKYHLKVWLWKLAAIVRPMLRARIIGVYWRKKMMQACEGSALVKTNFIVRRSYSGAHRTIELDPAVARKEYLDSISNSDFVLAPKGDGNFSNRFPKTLCMGRIPVLPDTDVVLPLESTIDYGHYMVRVPMARIRETPRLIREWYDALSEEEWTARQHQARELFETRLRFDSFFEYFFTAMLPALPARASDYRP